MSAARAVFLDRDGVLNAVVWRDGKPASPRSLQELVIEEGVKDALEQLKALGFRLFAVTNQPDVRRGKMSKSDLDGIHARLAGELPLEEIAACLHDDRDGCACRKPKPGLILELAQRYGIDVSRSWMVGDQDRDMASAQAAGCRGILLARPYNSAGSADHVVESLAEAVALLAAEPVRPSGPR